MPEGVLAVYKLSPIAAGRSALAWHQSYCTEVCWVNASSVAHARNEATLKTAKMLSPNASGQNPPRMPWENDTLSDCAIDDSGVNVPLGNVLGKSGRLYD
jgi:hypothetical protein